MYIKKYEANKKFQSVMNNLSKMGYDTSEKSNIRELFKELIMNETSFEMQRETILNSLNFENRVGEELESFFNFFGIKRIKNFSDSHASIDIMNNGSEMVVIKNHTFIKIDEKNYMTSYRQNIPANKKVTIHFTKTELSQPDFEKFKYNNISILIDDIELLNKEINKKEYLKNNLSIFNFKDHNEEEPDEIYLNRAKMILQRYGDSNIKKIRDYILAIQGTSDVLIKEEYDKVNVVIVPEKLTSLDRILNQAQEAVDYFATAHIELKKPTITEIHISGVYEQLIEWFGNNRDDIDFHKILKDLKNILNSYIKNLYFENKNELKRDMIEFLIDKYFSDNYIYFSLKEEKINIGYSIFTSEDYINPIVTSELTRREAKELLTDITLFKEVM